MNAVDISVIVPCYQEEGHLRNSVEEIFRLLSSSSYSFEMIFVDDCSRDNTRREILSIVKDFPNSKYLFHESNVGRGGSFLDGVNISGGKYVGFLDIDLEVSCVYILKVVEELEKGADVCTVRRHYAISPTPVFVLRHILSVGYKILVSRYLSIPQMDTETGFKFFRRDCILTLAKEVQNKKWFFDTEVMVLAHLRKYRIREVDGLFMRKSEKATTVKLFSDTLDYLKEARKFKRRLSS